MKTATDSSTVISGVIFFLPDSGGRMKPSRVSDTLKHIMCYMRKPFALTNIWKSFRVGRHCFGDHEHEDRDREQYRDVQCDFLSRFWRENEAQQGHGGHQNTREQEAQNVELGLSQKL